VNDQTISEIIEYIDADNDPAGFKVGRCGITRIEETSKPGFHCDIPYIRVWAGDYLRAEFCQHNIVGVYFAPVSA